jgi:hypothetical protein
VLPPGLLQYVQSVLVQVDATAAPAVRPTLSIAEQSGVVIATKRQGEAIPAADTGTATWALRLVDENPSGDLHWGTNFDDPDQGLTLTTPDGNYLVQSTTGDFTLVSRDGDMGIATTNGDVNLTTDQGNVKADTANGSGVYDAAGVQWRLNYYNPGGRLKLDLGGTFTLTDHLGAKLLEVTEGGTYHIKAGAAWVADL